MKSLETIKADNLKAARPARRKRWNGLCPAGRHGLDREGQACDLCAKGARIAHEDRVRARYEAAAKATGATHEAVGAVVAALDAVGQVQDGVVFDKARADAFLLLARAATELAGRSIEAAQLVRRRRDGGR